MEDDIVRRLRSDRGAGAVHWSDCEEAAALIHRQRARIAALEGALRFYAEPDKYTDCHGEDVQVPDFYSELDFGETARAALKGGE